MDANKRIIYPQLSYQIMGIMFSVHNRLGNQLQEKIYQKAVEERLKQGKIQHQREFYLPIQDVKQLLAYLQIAKLKLGILANFRTRRLTYRRIVNPSVKLS